MGVGMGMVLEMQAGVLTLVVVSKRGGVPLKQLLFFYVNKIKYNTIK